MPTALLASVDHMEQTLRAEPRDPSAVATVLSEARAVDVADALGRVPAAATIVAQVLPPAQLARVLHESAPEI
jgi:hypothetical protein